MIKQGNKQNGTGTYPYMGQPSNVNYNYKTVKCKYFDEGIAV